MSFSRSLYYPHIDIKDRSFLINAALFWEGISTIVPEDYKNPYRTDDTKQLADEGILTPSIIGAEYDLMKRVSEEAIAYIETNEGLKILLPENVKSIPDGSYKGSIFIEKLSWSVVDALRRSGQGIIDNNHIRTSPEFANFYMSLLAVELSKRHGLALLTNGNQFENLSNRVKRGDYKHPEASVEYGVGLLANLIIKGVNVSPETQISEIVKYRNNHKDELGQFRAAINELVNSYSDTYVSTSAMPERMSSIYNDTVMPSLNNLQKSLKASNILHSLSQINTSIFLPSVFTGIAIPLVLQPIATVAGLTVSILFNQINYKLSREKELRENRYSYVLGLEALQ